MQIEKIKYLNNSKPSLIGLIIIKKKRELASKKIFKNLAWNLILPNEFRRENNWPIEIKLVFAFLTLN